MTPHDRQIIRQQDVEYIVLPSTEDVQEKSLGAYVQIIRKRKWFFLAPLFIIIPLVMLYFSIKKPVYQARSTVLIESINPNIVSIEEIVSTERMASFPDFYRTQYEIIKSPIVLGRVVDKLKLYEKNTEEESDIVQMKDGGKSFPGNLTNIVIGFIESIFNSTASDKKEEDDSITEIIEFVPSIEGMGRLSDSINVNPEGWRRQDAIRKLQASLEIEPRTGTQLVDIILRGSSPTEVVQQVNAVAESYVRQNLENKLNASRKAIAWLKKESDVLREKINKDELSLQEIKKNKEFIDHDNLKGAQNPIIEKVNALQDSYIQIGIEKDDIRNRIQEIKKLSKQDIENMMGSLPGILNSYSIESLKNRYTELNIEYNNISLELKERHPKIIKIKSEIEKTKNAIYSQLGQIINGMQKEYDILSERERSIEKELIEQRGYIIERSNDIMQYEELQRDLEIDKGLYHTLSKRLAETTLTEALETNNVKVVETASLPGVPVVSGKRIRIVLSVVVALALGMGLAVFAESLDKRFRSVNEAEHSLGVPFLGFVPNHKTRRNEPVALYNPGARASEAYRTLRTWIRLSSQDSVKSLLITSAVPGEGKSHTAANLAISFAQLGQAVLLIDADLRRPMLHSIFNIVNNGGFTDILAHEAEWQSVLHDTAMENLKVLPTGGIPHNPAELLSTGRMRDVLGRLKSVFDIIIVDAPVVLSIPDVTILIPEADSVLLVHDPAKGDREAVLESKKILDRAGANLIGITFNNVNLRRQKHYHHSQKYHQHAYEPIQPLQKSKMDVSFVDMRPIQSRQKWVMQSDTAADPSHNESQTP